MAEREKIEDDFEIGGIIVDEILPYALEYYLGIKHDEGEEDGDFDDDMDSDDGEDVKPSKKKKAPSSKSKSKSKSKKKDDAKPVDEKPECKQQ